MTILPQSKASTVPVVRPLFPIDFYRAAEKLNCAGLLGLSNSGIARYIAIAEKAVSGKVDSVPPRLLQAIEWGKFYLGLSPMDQTQFRIFAEKCALANKFSTSL